MADISTLTGISDARNELYNGLVAGTITDKDAMARERVLRGQTEMKATVPMRLLSIISKSKNPGVAKYGEPLMRAVLKFTTGSDTPQIEADEVRHGKLAR